MGKVFCEWDDSLEGKLVICIDRDAPMYMVEYKDKQSEWVRTITGVPVSSSPKGYVAEYNKVSAKWALTASAIGGENEQHVLRGA